MPDLSPSTTSRATLVSATIAALALLISPAAAAPAATTGPSSSDSPYIVRDVPGVNLTSLLTSGDSVNGYRMAGLPDGLGAFDNGDGTFTVLANHELSNTDGTVRAHGAKGSFISRWVIDKRTLQVRSGSDLIQRVHTSGSTTIHRLCSADLPAPSAFFNAATGLGYDGRIFMSGEETADGRAFGTVVDTGDAYDLPALGKAAWENLLAHPATGDDTVVVGQSDGASQNVYVYHGTKQSTGSAIERAGLTNGVTKSIAVAGMPTENSVASMPRGSQMRFTLSSTGTVFDRPEDGVWDPTNPNVYYFTTTAGFTKHSRIWKATFADATQPELGGTIEVVLEGPDGSDTKNGPHMMDNLTVNDRGQIIVLEDVGNNSYLGGVYQVDPSTGEHRRVAGFDPERFLPGGSKFDTLDEESSGVMPVPFLGAGMYLIDAQNHTKVADPEIVEKGQLLLMHIPPGQPISKSKAV